MKNIIKFVGLFILILFSFFYSDRVASVIKSKDSLMVKIDSVSSNYEVSSIAGIISDNTIIPGVRGRVVNVNKSYKKMREYGEFNDDLIVYDYINPSNSLSDNMDKFIVKGNDSKNMVSIIFIVDNNYLDRIDSVIKSKDVVINYFVNSNYLINNSTYFTNLHNIELYNYGDSGKYYPDNLLFINNLITRITKNNAKYCMNLDYDVDVLSLCSKNNLYTVIPNVIIKSNPYVSVKNNINNGNIMLLELNNTTITELSLIIDYIKGKGLDIVGLSKLLSE